MKVVIDTNVFVSSVFGGLPRQVIEHWFAGRVTLCLSEEIFLEYRRVLHQLKAVSEQEEQDLVSAFTTATGVVYVNHPPDVEGVCRDPDDDKFLACALALDAKYIISGDADLLSLESYMGIPIVTPRSFLEHLEGS